MVSSVISLETYGFSKRSFKGLNFEDLGSGSQGAWVLLRLGFKKSGAWVLGTVRVWDYLSWIWILRSWSVGV